MRKDYRQDENLLDSRDEEALLLARKSGDIPCKSLFNGTVICSL